MRRSQQYDRFGGKRTGEDYGGWPVWFQPKTRRRLARERKRANKRRRANKRKPLVWVCTDWEHGQLVGSSTFTLPADQPWPETEQLFYITY